MSSSRGSGTVRLSVALYLTPPDPLSPSSVRPYQLRAVSWMEEREKPVESKQPVLHPALKSCRIGRRGATLYYCEWTGHLATEPTLLVDDLRVKDACEKPRRGSNGAGRSAVR
eukprot:755100-Hanusia_phi.AAC.4